MATWFENLEKWKRSSLNHFQFNIEFIFDFLLCWDCIDVRTMREAMTEVAITLLIINGVKQV